MNKIFEKIRSEIGKQKIKLDALSHMTGISVRTIQRILKDDDGKASNVFKICNALGIELKVYDKDTEYYPDFEMNFKIPVKKYYTIQKMFTTPTGNKIGQFVCIVNDELIAKDFCNKYPGCEYIEQIVECRPDTNEKESKLDRDYSLNQYFEWLAEKMGVSVDEVERSFRSSCYRGGHHKVETKK